MTLIGVDITQEDIEDLSPSHSYFSTFGFYIAGKAKKASEATGEILDITKKVIEVTEGFFVPTDIEYVLLTFYHDASPIGIYKTERSANPIERVVSNDDGVIFNLLKRDVDSIVIPDGQIKLVHEIRLDGRTKFALKHGERFIDGLPWGFNKSDDSAKIQKEKLKRLFWITISNQGHVVNESEGRVAPAYYIVEFETIVRAYGMDTDIGKANRALFRNMIKKFYASFDVYETMFWSDWFGEKELEYIAFKEEIYPEWKD